MTLDISAIVITYNEEANIERCLVSLGFAAEIVVVDSYSTDRTVELCRNYTDLVFQNPFSNFSAQKVVAIEKAGRPWIFWIDSDEEVDPELASAIVNLPDDDIAGYVVRRKTFYLDRWLKGVWQPENIVRLFHRDRGRPDLIVPHDGIAISGRTKSLPGAVLHYPYRDIADHLRKIDRHTTMFARAATGDGPVKVPPTKLLLGPVAGFLKQYLLKGGFRDGRAGLVASALSGWYVFLKYAKIWEAGLRR